MLILNAAGLQIRPSGMWDYYNLEGMLTHAIAGVASSAGYLTFLAL